VCLKQRKYSKAEKKAFAAGCRAVARKKKARRTYATSRYYR